MNIDIRPCTIDDLNEVLALEQAVLDTIERPDLLRRNSRQMWLSCLNQPHYSLGAWDGDKMIGLAVLYVPIPGDEEDLSVSLTKIDPAKHTPANFKICIVHPQWRGHHLQVILGNIICAEAEAKGYDLLCATISPLNTPSILNAQRLGFIPDHTTEKYGFSRTIYYKPII